MYMIYDTETYSLEIVFTFRIDPSFSRRSELPHGLSGAEACGVLFSLKCAGCTAVRKSELFNDLTVACWNLTMVTCVTLDLKHKISFSTVTRTTSSLHVMLFLFFYLLVFILLLLLFDLDITVAHTRSQHACSVENFERG